MITFFNAGFTLSAVTGSPLLTLAWIIFIQTVIIGTGGLNILFGAFSGCIVATACSYRHERMVESMTFQVTIALKATALLILARYSIVFTLVADLFTDYWCIDRDIFYIKLRIVFFLHVVWFYWGDALADGDQMRAILIIGAVAGFAILKLRK